ncbi:MAG: uncharacterized protein KVP18_003660 [Porospora cf. gigantea A]|uniref:uncharacterized protein n=1 Tax=Porospora cf. gigantea A TaxID=2853593 RepID=UPI00355AB248|nr:MAG: hypothetical protein KVP18_003660 [Porospora cf. gigantea A]
MIRSQGDYSRCYGCCPCSLRLGTVLISLLVLIGGGLYVAYAVLAVLEHNENWVAWSNVAFGSVALLMGLSALISAYRRKVCGVAFLSILFKIGLFSSVLSDLTVAAGMVTYGLNEGRDDQIPHDDKVAFYTSTGLALLCHAVGYLNIYWVLGTIKSLKNVIAAGGKGNEKLNHKEIRAQRTQGANRV